MATSNKAFELAAAELRADGVALAWRDGHQALYHPASLRHSPGFPGAARPAGPAGRFARERSGISPIGARLDTDGNLVVQWSDGRASAHDARWLRDNDYGANAQRRRPAPRWDGESIGVQREFDYAEVASDEDSRLPLFEQLLDRGVALLRDTPTEPNASIDIAAWFGHSPDNLYADDPARPTIGNVRVDPAVPVATSMCHFLGPHTDTCWRQTLCGLLLLHCLQAHPRGGRSILVDGFAVADRLRESDEDAFDLLARVPLQFGSRVADRDDWRVLGRVISLAADGELEGIRYNGNSIGQLELPAELIEPAYAALEAFEAILYDESLWWRPRLRPGDLLVIDNHRVLHGREAFDPALGERHLQSSAVDRDDFHNRYRRLARKLGKPGADQRLSAGVI